MGLSSILVSWLDSLRQYCIEPPPRQRENSRRVSSNCNYLSWDCKDTAILECKGKLIKEVTTSQGDLLFMKAGCQSKLWHKVLHNQTSQPNTVKPRYALSFRKIKSLYAFRPCQTVLGSPGSGLTCNPVSKKLPRQQQAFE